MSLNILSTLFLRTAPGLSSCRWSSTSALHQRLGLGQRQPPKPKVQHSRRLPSRQKIIAEQKAQGESRALERFHTRDWKAGDVYAPHDLSPQEMKKWSKRQSPSKDAFDALNLNPLDLYKNFSIMSEYISPLGRIKHRSETGLRPVNQRKIAKAIRRARGLGLMPSVHKHPEILSSDSRSRGGADGF